MLIEINIKLNITNSELYFYARLITNNKMTWGFVTCGPNEALVVSGKFAIERIISIDLRTIID